jgi:surface antigen
MRALAAAILATACLLFSPAGAAQFAGLLKNSPAELFDKADLVLFRDTARKALAEGADDQPLAWENPKNGHRGDMTVLKRFRSKGNDCTLIRVRNEAQGRKSDMQHNLCNIKGQWKLVGDSQL